MRLSNNELYKAIRAGLTVGVVGLVGVTGTAVAQDQDDARTLDRVEVVGSRIKRVEAETSQPTFEVTREDIEATGLTSIGDVIQNLTGNGSTLGTTVNNGGNGETRVSLRNLGSNRTLVLVNGRRWVNSSTDGAVDLNSIPAAAIESIQILKDGASAIYGSDAIAGVVDIRLRSNYTGAEMSMQWGEYDDGDGRRQKYDFLIGFEGDRGNVMIGAGYVKEDAVFAGDRAISAVPTFGLPPGDTSYAGASGIPPRARIFYYDGDGNGHNDILEFGAPGTSPDDYRPFDSSVDGYNFAPENYLQTPQERVSFFMDGRYQVLDNVEFYTQASFNERRSEQLLASMPVSGGFLNSAPAANAIIIPADHVYNPVGFDINGFGRRFSETGGRSFQQDVDTWNFVGGFQGDFMLGDRFFGWDVGYQYGKTQNRDITEGLINLLNLARGLGPSFIDDGGVARCGTPDAVISGCVPLNIFGPLGSLTPEMLDYATFVEQNFTETDMTNYWANISGDLFEIVEGNPAQFAFGYEYRKNSASSLPDAFTSAGLSSGNAAQPVSGSLDVDEFYAEINLPVLADVPFAQLLEFRAAGRYSDYSLFGDTTNLSAGFKWQPIEDLAVRGNWAEGFRAPNVLELFRSGADSFPTVLDPCSEPRFSAQPADVQQRCVAGGVPPGGYTQVSSQIRVTLGGNPNLTPETTTNKTLGFVYSPSWFEGFDISLDWYNIQLEEGIASRPVQFIINACYTGTAAEASLYCPLITRQANGSVADLLVGPINFALFEVEGYDMTLRYQRDTDWGRFGVVWDSTYTSKWEQTVDGEVTNFTGQDLGDDAYHRIRSNLNLSWRLGDFGANWGIRYYHHMVEDCSLFIGIEEDLGIANPCSDPDRVTAEGLEPRNKIPSTVYHDARFTWNTPWNGQFGVGLNNVFDKDPPLAYNSFANTFNTAVYEVPGRFWYLQYNQKF